jgi:hypothetical protein
LWSDLIQDRKDSAAGRASARGGADHSATIPAITELGDPVGAEPTAWKVVTDIKGDAARDRHGGCTDSERWRQVERFKFEELKHEQWRAE